MVINARRGAAAAVVALLVLLVAALPVSAATPVTVGSDLAAFPAAGNVCQGFPCVDMQIVLPGRPLTSPCDGTVTHWRFRGFGLDGDVAPQLRVMHPDGTGKFVATATSAPLAVGTTAAVYEADTSLPIVTGDQIAILRPSDQRLQYLIFDTAAAFVLFADPPDGIPVTPDFAPFPFELLFNADITCTPISPTSKDECKNDGWHDFRQFKNQGDCVSYVATQGKNPPSA